MGYTLHCTATGLYWTALLKGYPCEVHFTLHCIEYTKLYYSLVNCILLQMDCINALYPGATKSCPLTLVLHCVSQSLQLYQENWHAEAALAAMH